MESIETSRKGQMKEGGQRTKEKKDGDLPTQGAKKENKRRKIQQNGGGEPIQDKPAGEKL